MIPAYRIIRERLLEGGVLPGSWHVFPDEAALVYYGGIAPSIGLRTLSADTLDEVAFVKMDPRDPVRDVCFGVKNQLLDWEKVASAWGSTRTRTTYSSRPTGGRHASSLVPRGGPSSPGSRWDASLKYYLAPCRMRSCSCTVLRGA